jgi:pimeloyl-ACP methyl ester carboxylesterase
MTFALRSVDLPGRTRLQYVEQGDPSGIPVLLLHGYTDSWRSFERLLPNLPPAIHAFALTQRGHGDAGRPAAQDYAPRDFVGDVASFMHQLGIGAAVIAGHSMGSSIAQRFALNHPERTLGLALLGALTSWQRNPGVMELWQTAISTFEDPVDPDFVREFQQSTVSQPVPPGVIDAAVQESLKVPARVWRATFEAFLRDDLADEPGRIGAPALILWGDRDPLCPRADQEDLLRTIARSQLIVYRGAGHALHSEEPARCAGDLAAFARTLSDGGALLPGADAARSEDARSPATV